MARSRKEIVLVGAAADAMRKLEEHEGDLREFWAQCDKAWKAYEGVAELRSKALEKTNKLTPPYVMHIIETMLAAMLDPKLRFKVRPRPKLYEPGELAAAWQGAAAHESLLGFQLGQARFDEHKRAFVLQERVCGLSVLKVWWHKSERRRIRLEQEQVPGTPFQRLVQRDTIETAYDGPCIDVVDLHDFVFDLSSVSAARCGFMAQRILMSRQEIEAMADAGLYDNVGLLHESLSQDDAGRQDEKTKTFKDRVEVWEVWRREKGGAIRVYTVGNRNVLLGERDSPYQHGEMPFVLFSAQSKPFRIIGTSQVRKLSALQEMLWSVGNSRLDALDFANLGMALVQEDMDDPHAFRWESGAVNAVKNPGEVQLWTPNPVAAQVSLPAEAILKQDMQNLAGGQPFTSTSEARTVQANTATEASLVANIAQQNLSTAKTILGYSLRRMGQQMIELNQQYVRDDIAAKVMDVDTPQERSTITPIMLQGDFTFDLEPEDESLMRQERRAEAMALFNSVVQASAALLPIMAQGYMTPIDYDRVVRDLLESYDKDADLYFKQPAQPGQPGQAPAQQQQQQQSAQPPAGPPPQGVTNPELAAGTLAPSNGNSMSPVSALQQFQAAGMGGGRNS